MGSCVRRVSVGLVGLSLAAAVAPGCATSEGDALMKRGAYDEAAAAYDADLRAGPANPALERKRDDARRAALRAKLEQARAMRAAGHGEAALSLLNQELRMESRWPVVPDPDLTALRDGEIQGAGQTVQAAVDLASPLAATRQAAALAPLLEQPPLRPIADRMRARIAEAGKARCAGLAGQQRGGTPFLARLLVDYCARVGGSFTAPAPPAQASGLRVSGRLKNATEAQHRIVESWIAEVFRSSPWYAADAASLSALQLAGVYDASLERRRVMLSVPYRTVNRSVVTEGLLGPSATVETETEREFQYEAEQYDARYGLNATLTLELGAGAPLVVTINHRESKRGYEHDTRFPQANVYPQRANLPDVNSWLTTLLGTKRTALLRKLRGRWVKAYCGQARFSPEEAARCLQAGQRVPAAEQALVAVFGGDAQAVVESVTRPRGDERKPPADKAGGSKSAPKPPEIEEVPSTGGQGESI